MNIVILTIIIVSVVAITIKYYVSIYNILLFINPSFLFYMDVLNWHINSFGPYYKSVILIEYIILRHL